MTYLEDNRRNSVSAPAATEVKPGIFLFPISFNLTEGFIWITNEHADMELYRKTLTTPCVDKSHQC